MLHHYTPVSASINEAMMHVPDPLDIGELLSMHGQTANYPGHLADIPGRANSELCHSMMILACPRPTINIVSSSPHGKGHYTPERAERIF